MTFVPDTAPTIFAAYGTKWNGNAGVATGQLVTHSLTVQHGATEDGTGRGMPLVAAPLSHGSNPNSNAAGRRREDDFNLVSDIAYPLNARDFKGPCPDRSLGNVVTGFHMTQDPVSVEDGVPAWGKGNGQGTASIGVVIPNLTASNDPSRSPQSSEITQQVETLIRARAGVRRLTPTECERLQGLPDGWTLPGADSKRYAGLGDAVTANVAEWIGRRLQ